MLAGAAVAAPVAIFLLSGCGSDEPAAAQAPALNVTVSAGDGRFVTDRHGTLRLLLRGVNPRVEVADVSPGNSRTWAPTWLWARSWKRLYADYQPNTTVTWGAGRAKGRTSVALVHGRYVKGNLVFEVRPLAPGAKTPLPSVAAPRQTRDLGPVDMYVDPPIPLPAAAWASQELTTAAGLQISSTPWNAGTSRPIVPVLPGGAAYSQITAMRNQVVVLELDGNVGFGPSNLPGRTIVVTNSDAIGGYFIRLSLTNGGVLNLTGGRSLAFVGNNAFVDLDLSGGTLVPPDKPFEVEVANDTRYWQDLLDDPGSVEPLPAGGLPGNMTEVPTGNTFVKGNLTNATFANGYLGDSVFAAPVLTGATWNDSIAVRGTVFLGADFNGVTFAGDTASFAGATFAPFNVPSPDGGASISNSSFAGMNLGTDVSFGASGGVSGATFINADFTGTNLAGTSFEGANITGPGSLADGPSFGRAVLGDGASANFNGAAISDVDFTGATMGGASFAKAVIQATDFSAATFGSDPVSFQGATINAGTRFPGTLVPAQVSFASAQLDGVTFEGTPSAEFIAATMVAIKGTGTTGVAMGGTTYVKQGTAIYQVVNGQWQPLELQGTQLVPNGDPVAPGGGGGDQPAPDPAPDNNGGGGGNVDPVPANNGGDAPGLADGVAFGGAG